MAKTAPSPDSIRFKGDERLVVLYGEEHFLKIHHLHELRVAIERTSGGEVDVLHFDGLRATLADVLDELRSFGLMQQHKIVAVDDADEFVTTHREALERYAAAPVDIGTLVLRPTKKWVTTARLHKAIEKVGQVVKCETLKPHEAVAWAQQHCQKKYNLKIAPEAARLLVEHLDTDLGRLDTELGKLAAGIPEGQSIGVPQVESLVGRASDEDAWAVQEALLSGDARKAILKVRELIDLAGQPDILVVYFVADLMRKIYRGAAMAGQRMSEFAICQALKIWPQERQKPFMAAVKRLNTSRAAHLLNLIVELDGKSKSGLGKASTLLERFCIQFAGELR